jgi:hypothetical protein
MAGHLNTRHIYLQSRYIGHVRYTRAARGLEELFSTVFERFLKPIHDLHILQELGW